MISLLAVVAVGFFLGMRHATDPDHVIAVSTIMGREGSIRRASLVGAAWGLGHTLTIFLVGSAMIVFRVVLPPRVGLAMELAVGLMLILLGLKNLRGLLNWTTGDIALQPQDGSTPGVHYHRHGDYVHAHHHPGAKAHPHDPRHNPVATIDRWFRSSELYQWVRPLIIGVVHGLAGSAAIALLVLGTIADAGWGVAYLLVFGLGTVIGMMLITVAMGSTFAYTQKRFARVGRHFGWAAGLVSLVFGLFITYQIGFVDGLFTGKAHWLPR